MVSVSGAPVVVGVDGSASALMAVRLAADEAAVRNRPLRVVHAFIWPQLRAPLGPSPFGPAEGGLRNQAERVVAEAVAEATKATPGVTVTGAVVTGAPAVVLIRESRHAALVVTGSRGLGGFSGLLVGSVAVQVAAHAECPVTVARGTPRPDGPVVVGVDGSPLSNLAVGFAAEEAALRGTDLVAVRAFAGPVSTGPGDMLPLVYDMDLLESQENLVLAESLAGIRERYPDVPVTARLVRGRTADALIEQSRSAQLVVLGARGLGGFAGLLLGSVSQAVLHHAHCPLAIVRPAGSEAG